MPESVTNARLVLAERRERVLLLTLNRAQKLNALSRELLKQLADLLSDAERDPAVGCVVLTGAGRAFTAGADISAMLERGVESYIDKERLASWSTMENFAKPIIAAVNGLALGGGLELALLCDIVIAADTAKFATPEIKIGSFPGDGGTQRLPQLVGKSFAMQMILTGEMIDAVLAERKGLISEVVPHELLLIRAFEIAARIARHSTAITPYAKKAVLASFEYPLAEGVKIERKLTIEAFRTEDRIEGLNAFAEKRRPDFKDR